MEKKQLFGRRLKAIREEKGLTQEEVAEQVDISPNYVSGIERGTENPTFNVLLKLSETLQVDLSDMFDFKQEVSIDELNKMLQVFSGEIKTDENKLKLAVKILRILAK